MQDPGTPEPNPVVEELPIERNADSVCLYRIMRKAVNCCAASVTAAIFTGCVVLPLPHATPGGRDFKGQVIDARTARPVAGAKVTIEKRPKSAVLTGTDGRFAVSSGSNFHLIYYANPSWSLSLPTGVYKQVLLIEKSGYDPLRLDFADHQVENKYLQCVESLDDAHTHFDRSFDRTTLLLKPILLRSVTGR